MAEKINNAERTPTSNDAWQKLADEAMPFSEKPQLSEKEKSPERLSVDLMRNMLERGRIHPLKEYEKLSEYIQLRGQDLGIDQPINLFLRSEFLAHSQQQKVRYNPATDTIYQDSKWGWMTRAYHSPDQGTFIDFPMQPASESAKPEAEQNVFHLEEGEAAAELIDLAYTAEHELHHDLQFQKLKNREVSYDALRLAKDIMLINTLGYFTGDAEYFYLNAHNAFYIEEGANAAANDFLDKIIPIDGKLASKVTNPNAPPEYQRTFYTMLMARRREGEEIAPHIQRSLTLSANQIKMPEKTYTGEAEEIISDYCDDLIAQWPDYIKQYPALALEYNDDGSRRSRDDIESILAKAAKGGKCKIGGKEIPAQKLKIFYHKLIRNSKKLQDKSEPVIGETGSDSGDDVMSMENTPFSMTKEQTKPRGTKQRMAENWKQKRAREQTQREINERIIQDRQEASDKRQDDIQVRREKVLRALNDKAVDEELEDEDSMSM